MKELIQLLAQIALLRRGPQDLPASRLLLVLTLCAYVAVSCVVSSVLPPVKGWPAPVLVAALFTLFWYVIVLRVCGRAERTLQTLTAVFGLQALLSPLVTACEWLMLRLGQDTLWQLPIALAIVALAVWLIAANSHIVRAALEWSSAASVALVILQTCSGQLLLLALFPPAKS
jgi:hypothetical protein